MLVSKQLPELGVPDYNTGNLKGFLICVNSTYTDDATGVVKPKL